MIYLYSVLLNIKIVSLVFAILLVIMFVIIMIDTYLKEEYFNIEKERKRYNDIIDIFLICISIFMILPSIDTHKELIKHEKRQIFLQELIDNSTND